MKKTLLYILLTLFLAVTFYFWWKNSGVLFSAGFNESLLALGRLFGLLAVNLILLQLILIGRVKWVETIFGLDKLSIIHHYNGLFFLIFLLTHPLLMVLVYAKFTGQSFFGQIGSMISGSQELLKAFLATAIFIVIILLSMVIVRKKLKYESWYFTHLLTYLAIYLSFEHQFEFGGDFIDRTFVVYWYGIYIVGIGNLLFFRFIKPLWNFYRHGFYVDRVIPENAEVTSIYIKGRNLPEFKIRAGQFMIFRFLAEGYWWQAHPFSLSCAPNGDYLRISVKALGDFTRKIKAVPLGTKVLIDGPHGVFTAKDDRYQKYLLIAGGIGITPLRSLAETLVKQNKDVVLLYASHKERSIALKNELENLTSAGNLKLHYIISDDQDWIGEKGRIDQEKIQRLAPDYQGRQVYLCGPKLMMKAIIDSFNNLGLKRSKIFYEKFSLG